MKRSLYILIAALLGMTAAVSCSVDDRIKELSASISGRIVDINTGENVCVEFATATLLLGDNGFNNLQPVSYYIYPDGTFSNSKVYPGNYDIFANGGFIKVDTLRSVDIKGASEIELKVIPNVNLKIKDINVSSNGKCKVTVDYSINSEANSLDLSVLWSEIPFPGATTAVTDDSSSMPNHQKKYAVSGKTGSSTLMTATLKDNTVYYVRVGAKPQGSDYWNYSVQCKVTKNGVVNE